MSATVLDAETLSISQIAESAESEMPAWKSGILSELDPALRELREVAADLMDCDHSEYYFGVYRKILEFVGEQILKIIESPFPDVLAEVAKNIITSPLQIPIGYVPTLVSVEALKGIMIASMDHKGYETLAGPVGSALADIINRLTLFINPDN